jgi:hypothetical protein
MYQFMTSEAHISSKYDLQIEYLPHGKDDAYTLYSRLFNAV